MPRQSPKPSSTNDKAEVIKNKTWTSCAIALCKAVLVIFILIFAVMSFPTSRAYHSYSIKMNAAAKIAGMVQNIYADSYQEGNEADVIENLPRLIREKNIAMPSVEDSVNSYIRTSVIISYYPPIMLCGLAGIIILHGFCKKRMVIYSLIAIFVIIPLVILIVLRLQEPVPSMDYLSHLTFPQSSAEGAPLEPALKEEISESVAYYKLSDGRATIYFLINKNPNIAVMTCAISKEEKQESGE